MEEELARSFHKIDANSLVELKINFNRYLDVLKATPNLDLDVFVRLLEPRHLQDKLFIVQILQVFRRYDDLLNVFLQGNRVLCKVLLRDATFVRSFASMSPEHFVYAVCPSISYVSRETLIYRLSMVLGDEALGEAYYEAIRAKYGAKTARPLLVACGASYVLDKLDVKFDDRQLIYLHGRHPKVCEAYFKGKDLADYRGFARYVCLKDVELFKRLFSKTVHLGKRSFLKYLLRFKGHVVDKPFDFTPLRHKVVYRHTTTDEFAMYFKNLFAAHDRSLDFYSNSILMDCLRSVPRSSRGKFLADSLQALYGIQMWSTVGFVNSDVLKLLPLEDRLKFDDLDDDYVELNVTKVSVPTLKTNINDMSDNTKRANLCVRLIETCLINNEPNSLLEVLSYFSDKFFNGPVDQVIEAMQYLVENYPVENLGTDHWMCLDKFVEKLNDDNDPGKCLREAYYKKSVEYHFFNNLDCKQALINYLRCQVCSFVQYTKVTPSVEKRWILAFEELIPELYTDPYDVTQAKVGFLEWAAKYNEKNPTDRIYLYAYSEYILADTYETALTATTCTRQLLRHDPVTDEELTIFNEVLSVLSRRNLFNYYSDVALWLFKHKPHLLYGQLDQFFEGGRTDRFFRQLARMPNLELHDQLKLKSVRVIADPNAESESLISAVTFLSHFEAFDIFPELRKQLDRGLEQSHLIVGGLKNSAVPWKTIEEKVGLCNTGHLKSSLSTLQHALFHAPEKFLVEPVPKLRVKGERRRNFICICPMPPPPGTSNEYASRIESGDGVGLML